MIFIADGDDTVIELINISCSKKIMAHFDMCLKSRRRHLENILTRIVFSGHRFTFEFCPFSPELAKKKPLFFWGKGSGTSGTQDAFEALQGTLPTPSTKPASFSSATPILRDDPPACSHRSERGFRQLQRDFFKHFSSWSDITGGNTISCVSPLEVSFRVGSLAFSV